jgi:RNA polymerase sigma-70 factor (ECF subfamily)
METHSKQLPLAAFDQCRPQLRSYLFRLTAHSEDTEDLLQDTYVRAAEKLATFQGRSSLKTWLFTIATNLARDYLRSRKRWRVEAMDDAKAASLRHPEIHIARFMDIHQSSPQGAFELNEHINFCFTCTSKTLPVDEQVALLLKEIVAYKISEIVSIMGVSEGVVKHLLLNARKTMQGIFEKKCALINKEGTCHQCSELNGLFNPKQDFQEQLLKTNMGRLPSKATGEQLLKIRSQIAKAIDPYESKGAELQFCHFTHVRQTAKLEERSD